MKRSALVVAAASFALGALFYSNGGQSKPIPAPSNAALLARIEALEARSFKQVGSGYELTLNGARITVSAQGDVGIVAPRNASISTGSNLVITTGQGLTATSGQDAQLQVGRNLALTTGQGLALQSGKAASIHAGQGLDLRAGQDALLQSGKHRCGVEAQIAAAGQ